jgi:putative ABC transport system ATP-binding protein
MTLQLAPAIEAVDLYRFYHAGDDETLALRGVSLRAYPGEIVAVTGPSGSGKSTLIACLAGLDEPDGGRVRITGQPMTRRSEAQRAALRARAVGLLFQSGNLVDHLTVEQNVVLAQQLAGPPDRDRAATLLAAMGLTGRARALPDDLSGGETVRAGLAVALANSPPVVLADEPTGELDDASASHVLALLRRHAATGGCILIATHDAQTARVADREITLHDGMVSTGARRGP